MIKASILKNSKSVLVALSLSLLLTGCGDQELGEPLTRDYETYVGELKSLGGTDVQDIITHLFETKDGDILYSYSTRYDLDSEDYFGKSVEAYGVVTTYENLDKPLFEIKRITDAPEEDEEEVEVTMVDYQDPDFGFSMTYPSNWTLSTTPSSVILEAPIAVVDSEEVDVESTTNEQDSIVIARTEAKLEKTSEDTQDDRSAEVRSFVSSNYTSLADATDELTYVGPDRLLAVRYKTTDGDTLYFVPRSDELFEIGYYHEGDSDEARLDNSNTFASLVSGFRFTPLGEGSGTEDVTDSEEPEETEADEDTTSDTGTPTADQVSFKSYRELESKPYEFKMSYPGNWYYSGSSTGYSFSDKAMEDGDAGIISMIFNASKTEGVTRSGDSVSITVEVDGRTYTLTGPAEYETAMQTMAGSITSTKQE